MKLRKLLELVAWQIILDSRDAQLVQYKGPHSNLHRSADKVRQSVDKRFPVQSGAEHLAACYGDKARKNGNPRK